MQLLQANKDTQNKNNELYPMLPCSWGWGMVPGHHVPTDGLQRSPFGPLMCLAGFGRCSASQSPKTEKLAHLCYPDVHSKL